MKVKIKSFDVDMDVKAKGIEFEVRKPGSSGDQLGDCYLTMTGLTWCKGKVGKANGVKIRWDEFIEIMQSKESVKVALKAVRDMG